MLDFLLNPIQKFFFPTTLDVLQGELEKKPQDQSLNNIKGALRTLCLGNESIPIDLFKAYPDILSTALKDITQEALFEKKIVYHDDDESYEGAEKKPGEIHVCKLYYPCLNRTSIHPDPTAYYHLKYSICSSVVGLTKRHMHYTVMSGDVMQFSFSVFHSNRPDLSEITLNHKKHYEQYAIDYSNFILDNSVLIKRAQQELDRLHAHIQQDIPLQVPHVNTQASFEGSHFVAVSSIKPEQKTKKSKLKK